MSVRLFVGNLPYDATEDEIRDHFATAGSVSNVFIPMDRETGRKRGFAFVEFDDAEGAQEAVRLFNNQQFKGRPLAVNEARAREARPTVAPGTFRSGSPPRPLTPGAPRPFTPRPDSGGFSRSEPGSMEAPGRGDRVNRKFGPDAKPFRNRSQKPFRPESGKKAFKEKVGGQMHSMDEDADNVAETEIDDFATSAEDQDSEA
jgi:RNA recognition motif-containing protein